MRKTLLSLVLCAAFLSSCSKKYVGYKDGCELLTELTGGPCHTTVASLDDITVQDKLTTSKTQYKELEEHWGKPDRMQYFGEDRELNLIWYDEGRIILDKTCSRREIWVTLQSAKHWSSFSDDVNDRNADQNDWVKDITMHCN